MKRARQTSLEEESQIYTVSELTYRLQQYLETEYDRVCVEGEVSGYKVSQSGHAYFALKDEAALLNCVIWKSTRLRLSLELDDGQMIRATGGLAIYPPRGAYQLVVRQVHLAGEGLLLKRFEQLKRKLEAEGLFAPERKRPIPPLPTRIAVLTSPTGAAIRDFLKVLRGRFPGLEIDLYPVRVQGIEAAGEIAHALEVLGKAKAHEVLILTRGGGSLEDLWPFNEERLARAIAACPLPVISAVGHEIDFTIADFVADLRVPTPTAAAEYIVQNREDLLRKLDLAREALVQSALEQLDTLRRELDNRQERLERLSPLFRIGIDRQRVDERLSHMQLLAKGWLRRTRLRLEPLIQGLRRSAPAGIRQHQQRLQALGEHLRSLSPQATLLRGYSLTALEPSGRLLHSSEEVATGDRLRTRLGQGEVESQVIEARHGERKEH